MRIGPIIALVTFGVLLTGCYTLQPAGGRAPVPGDLVAFDITDQGRMSLGGSMGPEIGQIEGRLIGVESNEYIVSVRAVRFLRGGEQIWNGERVRISADHVGTTYERQFSRGRSVALGVVSIGSFAAFLITRDLLGLGQPDRDPDDDKPLPTELVRP